MPKDRLIYSVQPGAGFSPYPAVCGKATSAVAMHATVIAFAYALSAVAQ